MHATTRRGPSGEWVGVTEAAAALGKSYHATLRLYLVGELQGRRSPAGRWQIETASLQAFRRRHARGPKGLTRKGRRQEVPRSALAARSSPGAA